MRKPFNGNYKITQTFANKLYINGVDIYAQWGLKGHNGKDYGLPNDTPIYAPHDGTVRESAYDKTGYGWYIKIESNIEGSVLAHNRRFVVSIGNSVKEGQLIGYSNNSGYSTGAHLHWGYYRIPRNRNNGYNGYIDQTPYLITQPKPQPTDDPLKDQLKESIKLVKQLKAEQNKLNTAIRNKDDLIEKMKITFDEKYRLLQTEMDTALAQKELKCQEKIEKVTIRLSKDFDLKVIAFKKTISDLEKKQEKKEEVVVEPQPEPKKPKKLGQKIAAILEILFGA